MLQILSFKFEDNIKSGTFIEVQKDIRIRNQNHDELMKSLTGKYTLTE